MFILLHVVVALATLASSASAVLRPSRNLIVTSYAMMAATLASGIYLVIVGNAHLVRTCATGLVFVAVCSACLAAAQRRLAVTK